MLGGVRTPQQTAEELADDVVAWGANGFGIWAIREAEPLRRHHRAGAAARRSRRRAALRAMAGGAGPRPRARGGRRRAALRTYRPGCTRIVAVARESNFASRMVLGGIGMTECGGFVQHGHRMVMYESVTCLAG